MSRPLIATLVALAVLAAAGLAFARWRARGGSAPVGVPVEITYLVADRERYDGRAVSLALAYDKRAPADPVAELVTRSDCYLHDDTGSILLVGGWQVWMRWQEDQEFRSDWLDVDASGLWRVKKAVVRYNERGLPYLEPPRG